MHASTLEPATAAAGAAADDAQAAAVSPTYRRYVLGALAVVSFMCAVDRIVISMFVEPIKREFGLSDTQLGLMTGIAFAIMHGLAAIPLARWADRGNRKWIVNGCLAAWSLMTALSGMAMSFVHLLLARVGVGIGEAGCIPASHSMIGDYYARTERPQALGIHMGCAYLGMLGGMLGGGILVQTVGWRAGFLWLGVAGLLMSVVFHFTVREPARSLVHEPMHAPDAPPVPATTLRAQLGDMRAFGWLVVAFSTTALAGTSIMFWLPSYFERAFALTPIQIGLGLGICLGVATALGSVAGGRIAARRGGGARSWGAGFAAKVTAVVMPLFLASFNVPHAGLGFVLLFAAFATAGMILGPIFAILQDLVAPQARATAVAVVSLAGVLVGQGFGPLLVGAISDAMGGSGSGAGSLRLAMTIVACVNFLTCVAFWQLRRRIDVLSPPGT